MSNQSNFMPDLPASQQRCEAAVGARGVARMLLASWLFTLAVCFYSDIHPSSMDMLDNTPAVHQHNALGHSDDSAQETDVCCTLLQNLPPLYKIGHIEAPLQHLIYTLFPYVFVVQSALLVTALVHCTGPPCKHSPLLTANLLWPNAPPR